MVRQWKHKASKQLVYNILNTGFLYADIAPGQLKITRLTLQYDLLFFPLALLITSFPFPTVIVC